MTILHIRAATPYEPGANATDVIVNEVHFNRTTLDLYKYTLYSNGTLSNGTDCYLAFQEFQPRMDENGTFVDGISCYAPIHGIGQHASIGMAFTAFFAVSMFLAMFNLRKHGRKYLPGRTMGRRLKWLWLLFVAACGLISCIMTVDVDRSHIQGTSLILQSVFYTLMTPGLMAAVWEAVRHWASWQERQILDRDPYAFTKRSSRRRQESLLPILFYAFALANFFLTIPRSWTGIELQRSPELTALRAQPLATDLRFKLAAFMSLAGTLVICYSLEHSIYRYRAAPTSPPPEFLVALVLLGLKTGYTIAAAFDWSVSPLRVAVSQGWLYGLGYAPALLIIVLFNAVGFCELNEDKALIVQRGELDSALATDADLHGRKRWWESRWLHGSSRGHVRDRSSSREQLDRYVEMGILAPHGKGDGEDKDGSVAAVATAAPRITTRTASDASSSSESDFLTVTVASPGRRED
ncbi:DUF2434 domain-containing protein [Aspergillus novofumigatus IBT 16806]|uniref:Uncharacterized protein n=1 Tax=Aspergillus novofumigatus (strain IBT 16806) TaxID=1392255 RepID=A0A2I1C2Z0_ASPN1|nr:uncharacterized protein P174DRAFT_492910 [Aspergillus novofumigatus IBT 16806]PKX91982.1 hypothetical protein P174DRAFT_492910 [Aspergillus novofumigatus IBT 16806]